MTTTVEGDQFVCLNLAQTPGADLAAGQPTYVAQYPGDVAHAQYPGEQHNTLRPGSQLINFGTIQAPVHSQLVIQRVGTLPRQYAHPLAQL